jgi:hypothetical protein
LTRWTRVSNHEDWWSVFGEAGAEALSRIAFDALSSVPRFIRPSFEELYSEGYVVLFNEVIAAYGSEGGSPDRYHGLMDRIAAANEEERGRTPGAASLSAGIMAFLDGAVRRFDREVALEVLHQCYEAVLHAEMLPDAVLRTGEDNEHCAEFIEFQRGVIARYIVS